VIARARSMGSLRARADDELARCIRLNRPVCARCGTKFTDERWRSVRQTSWGSAGDDLCEPCWKGDVDRAEAERAARREAEEAAVREAAEAETEKGRGLFGRRR
jgi:hypothetical protein